MAEYRTISDNTRCFRLLEGSRTIGELAYPKWFTLEATLTLTDQSPFQIMPKGFWGTTIELRQHDVTLLHFKMGWNGNIILHTDFSEQNQDFVFQQKGLFKGQYVLTDAYQQELLVVQPDFTWQKLHYDFHITTADTFENLAFKDVLLLLAVHCANYYLNMVSATAVIATT